MNRYMYMPVRLGWWSLFRNSFLILLTGTGLFAYNLHILSNTPIINMTGFTQKCNQFERMWKWICRIQKIILFPLPSPLIFCRYLLLFQLLPHSGLPELSVDRSSFQSHWNELNMKFCNAKLFKVWIWLFKVGKNMYIKKEFE